MRTYLLSTVTMCLFGCGASSPQSSTPAPAPPPAAEPGGEEESDDATAEPKRAREASDAGEFEVKDADKSSRPTQAKLVATETEAAVRFFVIDKDKGPVPGIVISLTSPTGQRYFTAETDAEGFAEVLVPVGQTYELVFLSLGRRDIAAKVDVADKPRLNLKLTLRYQREEYASGSPFVLGEVQFETGKATLTATSYERLDALVEYMTHKKTVRVRISGHTDNVGNKKANKVLSQKRADAVRDYLVSKGIDASRIEAVGYGGEKPIAPNDTGEGRQKNRRIEATEL